MWRLARCPVGARPRALGRARRGPLGIFPRPPVVPSEKVGLGGCQEGLNTEPEEVRLEFGNPRHDLFGT